MGQVLSRASHFIARFSEMSRASHFTARFSEMQFWSPNILNHATRPQESMKTILGRKSIFTWIVNKFYRTGASQRYGLYFLTLGCWTNWTNHHQITEMFWEECMSQFYRRLIAWMHWNVACSWTRPLSDYKNILSQCLDVVYRQTISSLPHLPQGTVAARHNLSPNMVKTCPSERWPIRQELHLSLRYPEVSRYFSSHQ